ncbi:hypothetical protein BDW02DRAFT_599508 [Decorospora gaudefroyi]|uniref:Uncharacterized protein n=1 Tax=Decorospora gaudefroyi TaxID=184978 RepID=A0A6A5KAE7_9PLEO|nr:hypothetical protein BDW02DRAFT_599508 [Decorospora gaudefroyi]
MTDIPAKARLTFEEAFEKLLPMELKQMVFKWAATNCDNDTDDLDNDIRVQLEDDQGSLLRSSAIDLLDHLKNNVANVDIRVFWGDFFKKGRTSKRPLRNPVLEKAQKILVNDLKQNIPARSTVTQRN